MKKLNLIVKALLVVMLLTGTSVVLSTQGVKTVHEAKAAVTEAQVIAYLEELGYIVQSAAPKPGTLEDWICHTFYNGQDYWTTVYVQGNCIVGTCDTMYY